MSGKKEAAANVTLHLQSECHRRLAWRYLASQGLPLFAEHCAVRRATSHILLGALLERQAFGNRMVLSLAFIAVVVMALEAWIGLGREDVVADLAIRAASAIALTVALLDADEARCAWAAARRCIQAIKAGQPDRALCQALQRQRHDAARNGG